MPISDFEIFRIFKELFVRKLSKKYSPLSITAGVKNLAFKDVLGKQYST
jgi:hypothetical protein